MRQKARSDGQSDTADVAVIGGGIVGLATALSLSRAGVSVAVLEAERRVAAHQTGHNSGVVHSGLYYKPGSSKARNCVAGREAMFRFCEENAIPHERCGKLVVATERDEVGRLDELERRGRENGLTGLRRLDPAGIRELEPHAAGIAALHVPETGIVDFEAVARALGAKLRESGVPIVTGARIRRVDTSGDGFALHWDRGVWAARHVVNCAGLHSDRVARMCGLRPRVRIVPIRGEYYRLRPARACLVRNLIYPVPDPQLPFLGVHLTRRIGGEVEAGPNAVLAFKREGYRRGDISLRDLAETLAWPGFWKLALRHGRLAAAEARRSTSRRAFVRAAQRLVPEIGDDDLRRHGAGVRAQAVRADGALHDDFEILEAPRMLHVLNAPSPAATASLEIGRELAGRAAKSFGLEIPGA
ncbi:MAG: L-2-hydroxyglutarate oxidase [bacterium]|nr:L-2-hydroxyglutarate oxidase [bacterium]